jgi:F420-0:gamma-glutamyl ligase-like protein
MVLKTAVKIGYKILKKLPENQTLKLPYQCKEKWHKMLGTLNTRMDKTLDNLRQYPEDSSLVGFDAVIRQAVLHT